VDGNQAIAKILKLEGVEWVAAFPYQSLIDTAAIEGIRPIICRHERTGVNMADGFSRVTNGERLGVFTMQLGPGAENALGGVAQAYADSIPILLLPGGQPLARTQVHPNFEAVENYRGITKWAANINQGSRIPELLRRAFTQLKNGRPGPVLLEIPSDVAVADFPAEDLSYQPVKPYKSAADPDDVRDLVNALLKANCPVINAGHGILWAKASAELVELAELLNLPVMTTLAGKSAFPENHALSLGTGSYTSTLMVDHFLKQTDFVLGAGTSFTASSFNAPMPAGVPLAQVTNCPEDLNKDYPISFGAIGDAKLVLRQIIAEAKAQLGADGRQDERRTIDEVARIRGEFRQQWRAKLTSDEVPINPYRVFVELAKAVDVDHTIITHDSGYPRDQLVPFWQSTTPRGYLGWGKSTQLGYGLGLALGAKMAAPEKTVINVMGDAAFGMAGMDIETAVRAQIPILTVVLNNGVMTHYDQHMPYASEHWGSNRLGGHYAQVGQALGAHAERIETPDQLAAAIQRALQANGEGQPALIEVMTKVEEDVPKFW
jgi:thiamine pyrophosphate-dependent acetolactate synthase large subunit-like protein